MFKEWHEMIATKFETVAVTDRMIKDYTVTHAASGSPFGRLEVTSRDHQRSQHIRSLLNLEHRLCYMAYINDSIGV